MKNLVVTTLVCTGTLIAGLYIGAKYIGQGEVIVALCVVGDVAVKENHLNEQQLLDLFENAGQKLKMEYPILADSISLSDESASRASEHSNCSQMLIALTKGINK